MNAQARLNDQTGYPIQLKQGNLDLFVDSDHLYIEGSASLNDMPAQLEWTEYFNQTAIPFTRKLALHATKTFIPNQKTNIHI